MVLTPKLALSLARRCVAEPKFVGSAVVPDNDDPDDDKVYYFFTEKAVDVESGSTAVYTRIARACAVRREDSLTAATHASIHAPVRARWKSCDLILCSVFHSFHW